MKSRPLKGTFPQLGAPLARHAGPNFTLVQLGDVAEIAQYGIQHPGSADGTPFMGKVFLKQFLDLTAMEISYGVFPAQASIPFLHKHGENEEVYLFLQGQGQIQIDGERFAVGPGTAVRIAPAGVRAWRNSSDSDLFYIVIQAKAGSLEHWTGTDGQLVPGPVEWPAA